MIADWTQKEREQARRRIEIWRQAAPELERIREEEIRTANTAASIRMFGESQQLAKDLPPRLESGLAIWQDHMKRWRKKINDRSAPAA